MNKKLIFLLTGCIFSVFSMSSIAQTGLVPITPDNVDNVQHLGAIGADRIFDLTWSPDGSQLAVIGEQGIRIHNPDDLSEAPLWLTPIDCDSYLDACYGSLQYKDDGKILIGGTNDDIIFWDTETWQISAHYHNDDVDMANFIYDFENERLIFGGRYPNEVVLLKQPISTETQGNPVALEFWSEQHITLIFSQSIASDVALTTDNRYLALSYGTAYYEDRYPSLSALHDIALWNLDELFSTLNPISNNTVDIEFELDNPTQVRVMLEGHSDSVRQLSLNSDDSMLASAGLDATLRLWDVNTKIEEQRIQFVSALTTLSYHPDGNQVAVGTWNGSLAIVDTTSGETLQERPGLWASVWQITFSPDGNLMATAMNNGEVLLWNRLDQYPYFEMQRRFHAHNGAAYTVAFSPDGTLLASAGRMDNIHIWDVETGDLLQTFIHPDGTIYDLSFSPYDNVLVSTSWYGSVYFWDLETGTVRGNPIYTDDHVYSIAFHPQENQFAYGDTVVASYSQYRSDTILSIETPRYWSDSYRSDRSRLEFSPDGTQLLNSSGLSTYIWNLDNLLDDSPRLGGFATFNPVSSMFVIASAAEQITFYSTEIFEPLAENYFVDEDPYRARYLTSLRDIVFTPDGSLVISAGVDGKLHLWGIP